MMYIERQQMSKYFWNEEDVHISQILIKLAYYHAHMSRTLRLAKNQEADENFSRYSHKIHVHKLTVQTLNSCSPTLHQPLSGKSDSVVCK